MDYGPMQVIINPPRPRPPQDDITIRKSSQASNELHQHHSSHDQHYIDDEIMVTKDNHQTLFIGVLSHQEEDTEDSDMDHKSDHGISEFVKSQSENGVETKIKLNFSVDRLLSAECGDGTSIDHNQRIVISTNNNNNNNCCGGSALKHAGQYDCCKYLINGQNSHMGNYYLQKHLQASRSHHQDVGIQLQPTMDIKSVVRPTPIRALTNGTDEVLSYSSMASSILKFHQHQHHQHHHQQQAQSQPPPPPGPASIAALSSLMAPFSGLKSLQINQHHFRQQANIQAASKSLDIPQTTTPNGGGNVSGSNGSTVSSGVIANSGKRKRSWSRAVFSNLQRKGLEIQFQQQKYITKPDRRKLAARLNLTDAQVKVWFQNRRMKWRHTRENLKSGQEKPVSSQNGTSGNPSASGGSDKKCYTSSSDSDEDEIDVVE